jgi:tetrapyrrole methylase family protein/MazG family protein
MNKPESGSITIVGLGPGAGDLVSRRAWQILKAADVVYVRTQRHPAVGDLPSEVHWESFDHIYDEAADFSLVYQQITEAVMARLADDVSIVYAVPGDATVGEATATAIVQAAREAGVPVNVVPGISFIEPTLAAIGLDALNGLQLFDAITIAGYHHPPVNPDYPLLLGQVYSRLLANELKLALMAVYPDEHGVVLVHEAGTDSQVVEALPLYEIDRSEHVDHMTTLYVPPLPAPASLAALAEDAATLRGPGGCPWDQEQTPQSLRSGLLEEVSEVLEALDVEDPVMLQEELGDVLFHIVMQAQMAREEEQFRLSDVVSGIYTKIRRRHPHVWSDWEVEGSDEVVANWEAIKAEEKGKSGPASLVDGIPAALPALAYSQKIQERVRKVGFDWPEVEGVVAKVREELDELLEAADPEQQANEMGDLLFAVVNWARWLDLDAESILREANWRFSRRFRLLEEIARERGVDLSAADAETLDLLWQEAKRSLNQEKEN